MDLRWLQCFADCPPEVHCQGFLETFPFFVHLKQFQNTSCQLTERGIKIRKGWIFKAQQNIPLDKLTDISIHEGPILNIFGIVRISIETAGATPFTLVGLNKSTTALDDD